MYSTTSHQLHVEKALALGAFCLLTKPDNFKNIKQILTEVIDGLPQNVVERIKMLPEAKWKSQNA